MKKKIVFGQILEIYSKWKKEDPAFFKKNKRLQLIEEFLAEVKPDSAFNLKVFLLMKCFIDLETDSDKKKKIIELLFFLFFKRGEDQDFNARDGFGVSPIQPIPVLVGRNPWPEPEPEKAFIESKASLINIQSFRNN